MVKTPLPEPVKVALQTGAERFHGQGGLEVDRHADRSLFQGLHDGKAHQKRDRPPIPKWVKSISPIRLSMTVERRLFLSSPRPRSFTGVRAGSMVAVSPRKPSGGRFGGSPLHRPGPFDLRNDERNEGRPELGHGMAEGSRHSVSVAVGAGRRPRSAAGRQDDGAGGIASFFRPDSFDAAIAKVDPVTGAFVNRSTR